ncbi:MAG: hypothetical protein WCS31_04565 [Verrucomicrobiae bacterium]
MARFAHYSPPIRHELIRVLSYERVRRGIPMAILVDEILSPAPQGNQSWQMMEDAYFLAVLVGFNGRDWRGTPQ